MTTSGPQHPHDARIDEREWQWQERARAPSRSAPAAGDDADALAQYRRIDAALRQPPATSLPAGFAATLAARVRSERRDAARFERRLIAGLVIALVATGIVLAAFNAETLAVLLRASLGQRGLLWAIALAACVASSFGLDAMRRDDAHRARRDA